MARVVTHSWREDAIHVMAVCAVDIGVRRLAAEKPHWFKPGWFVQRDIGPRVPRVEERVFLQAAE